MMDDPTEEYLYGLADDTAKTVTYPGEGMGWYGFLVLDEENWAACPDLVGYHCAIIHIQYDGGHEWWLLTTDDEAEEEWAIIEDKTGWNEELEEA